MKSFFAIFFSLFLNGVIAQAQNGLGWMVESNFHYGQLIKHTPKLRFEVTQPSYAFELNFKKQLLGNKSWHQMQNYPTFGIAAMHYTFGNADFLGSAFSIAPNLGVYLSRKEKFDLQFVFGYGLAYLNKPFDFNTNPQNNAIGSSINATVQLRFVTNFHFHPKWSAKAGISFTHYSNGASSLPNFGLNVPGAMLGLRHRFVPFSTTDLIREESLSKKPLKRFGLDAALGIGYRERGGNGGPRQPIYIASIGATYQTNKINRLHLGGEYEYNQGVYLFGKHVGEFDSEREARIRSMRFSLFVADELYFGKFSLSLHVGAYLHNVYLGVFPIYNRFIVRYYFPPVGKQLQGQFYTAIQLKSHLIIAEYFSIMGGVKF